jgi:hypothetical protein
MIDWWMVARGALWILGLAIALASFSYAEWWRSLHRRRLREALNTPRFLAPFSAGLALFSVGLALSSSRWWEAALWGALMASFALQAGAYWRAGARHGWDISPPASSISEEDEDDS